MSESDADAPRTVGRPTDYRAEYCERVIELGKRGKSKAQIAADLSVSRMTLDNWSSSHPEFLDAINMARDFALAWWETKAQEGMTTGAFAQGGAAIWSRSMAARFPADYREEHRTVLAGDSESPLTVRTVDDLTDEQLAAIAVGGRAASAKPTPSAD